MRLVEDGELDDQSAGTQAGVAGSRAGRAAVSHHFSRVRGWLRSRNNRFRSPRCSTLGGARTVDLDFAVRLVFVGVYVYTAGKSVRHLWGFSGRVFQVKTVLHTYHHNAREPGVRRMNCCSVAGENRRLKDEDTIHTERVEGYSKSLKDDALREVREREEEAERARLEEEERLAQEALEAKAREDADR